MSAWVTEKNAALLTDLYELTMLQAYLEERLTGEAVFSLFVRRLPPERNFFLAAGLEDALEFLESCSFSPEALEYLGTLGLFRPRFLRWLEEFRFTGDVYAVPEGTPVFAQEPILEVVAPLPEAQLIETFLLNQVHLGTLLASKAARVVRAARGCKVVDFGLRRMQGADAGLKAARAFYIAGVDATSNVLAGQVYGIPVAGTMAHSYIQAHASELEAFRAFCRVFPETTLLVDTYDTREGVKKVIRLAEELGAEFRVRAVRLDSGDLGALAKEARGLLDEAGLTDVEIFASGGLDEKKIEALLAEGAPIDGFGVGTAMGVSEDAPALDIVYKMVAYAGEGRLKLSPEKGIWPGQKQIFRVEEGQKARFDILAQGGERQPGRPLLTRVMEGGRRTAAGRRELSEARERAREELSRLPEELLGLSPASRPYPVRISEQLQRERDRLARKLAR